MKLHRLQKLLYCNVSEIYHGKFACVFVPRFDVDFTEVHSYMTRGEAILQSPEFSLSRKDGSIQELQDKVQVKKAKLRMCLRCRAEFHLQKPVTQK